jgi:hypothetical protein
MSRWIQSWISVRLTTLRLTDKLSESIKPLKTCCELVLWNMAEAGIRVYPMQSFLITIVIRKAWRWHHSRCYMVKDVGLRYFGMRLENDKFLDPTLYKTFRSKSIYWEKISRLPSHAKRVTQTVGVDTHKTSISCTNMLSVHLVY